MAKEMSYEEQLDIMNETMLRAECLRLKADLNRITVRQLTEPVKHPKLSLDEMEIIELDIWEERTRRKIRSLSKNLLQDELYLTLLAQRCIALGEDAEEYMSRDDMMLASKTFLDHMCFPID